MKKQAKYHPLCHRCEHRVRVLEGQAGPRYECQQKELAVISCYMYTPVIPVGLKKRTGDKRPLGAGWMIAARAEGVALPKVQLRAVKQGKLIVFWQEPEV